MTPLLLALAYQTSAASAPSEPKTIILVRRPEEASLTPKSTPFDKPLDLKTAIQKARQAGYSEGQLEDTLYLCSPSVLPLERWRAEARVRKGMLEKIAPDGTLRVRADSEEARYLLDRLGMNEDYGDELVFGVSSQVQMTLRGGGRSGSFILNGAKRTEPRTPEHVPTGKKRSEGSAPRGYATTEVMRGDYSFQVFGAATFSPEDTMARRKIALGLYEERAKEYLRAESEASRAMYAALASLSVNEGALPSRGTSFASLSPGVKDDIHLAIRSNPKAYGFTDEEEALKWLASTEVGATNVAVGLGISTRGLSSVIVLGQRRY